MTTKPRRIIPRRLESLRTEVIYANSRHYAKNPDFCLLPDGRILCVFLEADQHIPLEYARIILMESADGGNQWGKRRVVGESSTLHNWGAGESLAREPWITPRISRLRDDRLAILCDKDDHSHDHDSQEPGIHIWWSSDEGATWTEPRNTGIPGIEPDKVVETPAGTLLIGTHVLSSATQRLGEYVARSTDRGQTWRPVVPIARDDIHNYCEGSIVPLPSGRLVCVMRENNHNNYPCYLSFSDDDGLNWSTPVEAPFSGDRPYGGVLSDGRFFVTYPDQAGLPVTNAWVGDIEREHGYKVSIGGRNRGRATALFTSPISAQMVNVPSCDVSRNQHLVELEGGVLRIANAFETPIRYHLLPPDYRTTAVDFEAEVRVVGRENSAKFAVQIARVGIALEVAPGWLRIAASPGGHARIGRASIDMTIWRHLNVTHRGGLVDVVIDGRSVARSTSYVREQPWDRSFFGSTGDAEGTVELRQVQYATHDAQHEHHWSWAAASGTYPNQYEIDRWVTLAENHEAFPDHGYTTWIELPGGKIVVAETTSSGAPLQKAQLHAYFFNLADL